MLALMSLAVLGASFRREPWLASAGKPFERWSRCAPGLSTTRLKVATDGNLDNKLAPRATCGNPAAPGMDLVYDLGPVERIGSTFLKRFRYQGCTERGGTASFELSASATIDGEYTTVLRGGLPAGRHDTWFPLDDVFASAPTNPFDVWVPGAPAWWVPGMFKVGGAVDNLLGEYTCTGFQSETLKRSVISRAGDGALVWGAPDTSDAWFKVYGRTDESTSLTTGADAPMGVQPVALVAGETPVLRVLGITCTRGHHHAPAPPPTETVVHGAFCRGDDCTSTAVCPFGYWAKWCKLESVNGPAAHVGDGVYPTDDARGCVARGGYWHRHEDIRARAECTTTPHLAKTTGLRTTRGYLSAPLCKAHYPSGCMCHSPWGECYKERDNKEAGRLHYFQSTDTETPRTCSIEMSWDSPATQRAEVSELCRAHVVKTLWPNKWTEVAYTNTEVHPWDGRLFGLRYPTGANGVEDWFRIEGFETAEELTIRSTGSRGVRVFKIRRGDALWPANGAVNIDYLLAQEGEHADGGLAGLYYKHANGHPFSSTTFEAKYEVFASVREWDGMPRKANAVAGPADLPATHAWFTGRYPLARYWRFTALSQHDAAAPAVCELSLYKAYRPDGDEYPYNDGSWEILTRGLAPDAALSTCVNNPAAAGDGDFTNRALGVGCGDGSSAPLQELVYRMPAPVSVAAMRYVHCGQPGGAGYPGVRDFELSWSYRSRGPYTRVANGTIPQDGEVGEPFWFPLPALGRPSKTGKRPPRVSAVYWKFTALNNHGSAQLAWTCEVELYAEKAAEVPPTPPPPTKPFPFLPRPTRPPTRPTRPTRR